MFKQWLKSLKKPRDNLPEFEKSDIVNYHVLFFGRVQGVGFRIEVYHMALKLDICGWVRNLQDGSVEAVFQGEQDKVEYLINYMTDLQRADVQKVEKNMSKVFENMTDFKMR